MTATPKTALKRYELLNQLKHEKERLPNNHATVEKLTFRIATALDELPAKLPELTKEEDGLWYTIDRLADAVAALELLTKVDPD